MSGYSNFWCIVLQNKKFLHIGRLMAMGVVQGSSGVPFFSPPVNEYLCGKDVLSITVTLQDVPLYEVRELLNDVSSFSQYSEPIIFTCINHLAKRGDWVYLHNLLTPTLSLTIVTYMVELFFCLLLDWKG